MIAALLLVLGQQATQLARAESLLVAGHLQPARALLEPLARRTDDPRALTLLGRVHLAWPAFGRYAADSLLSRAGRLAPDNPEPFYWLGHAGLALGGDDGEMTARRGLARVLALDPLYRDAWPLWLTLYRGDGERRDALRSLAAHAAHPAVRRWRALLLLESRRYGDAEAELRALAEAAHGDPAPEGLLARLLFEQGRDDEGAAAYEAALALAPGDTAEVLWRQVRSIATPAERRGWPLTAPEDRTAFLRLFWARREPDVRSSLNERLGEHFRRMARAQLQFRVLHPNSRFHRSAAYRHRMGVGGTIPPDRDLDDEVTEARAAPCSAKLPGVRDARYEAGMTDVVDGAGRERTLNLEDGLDDRGRILVRHGEPDARYVFGLDGETWCYVRDEGVFRVTFLRLGGDLVVRPVRLGEAESAAHLLATDRPTMHAAALTFRFWPATFRLDAGGERTELLLFPGPVDAVAVLVDAAGRSVARDSSAQGRLRLAVPPGHYALLLDAGHDDRMGSYRGTVTLPRYGPDSLAVSGLLVAAGAPPATRDTLERAAPPGLRLAADVPMRFYAEVYGLRPAAGIVRYEARYRFERTSGGFLGLRRTMRTSTITFERTQPHGDLVIETLVVDPGRLPRGRYHIVLEITDRALGTRAASSVMELELR